MHTLATRGSIANQANSLVSLFEEALEPRDPMDWSHWMQGEMRRFLPHDAIVAAWGDLRAGAVAFEVLTSDTTRQLHTVGKGAMERLMMRLFESWVASGQQPIVVAPSDLRAESPALARVSQCALAHGIEDHRGRYDCVYLFFGPNELASPLSRQMCRIMLPFLDTGFRQLPGRADDHGPGQQDDAPERGAALSARELEIMQWVRRGKTNSEIAIILNLSTFTVKNHMRRIYRKLDVLNRAQAVGSLDSMQHIAQHAAR